MAYPEKPTGTDILPFDSIFAINNSSKTSMTTGEILDGYNNDGEPETDLTSRPDANKFNMFLYQVHNTIKWVVSTVDLLIAQKLETSGGTMTGLLNMGSNKVLSSAIPTNDNDLVNKKYIDEAVNGAMWIGEVKTLAYPSIPTVSAGIEIVPCDGRALSRTTYSELFSLLGTAFGAGNGSTTFNIPDYRGLFLRGWDGGSGRDSGRIYGQIQSSGVPNIKAQFRNGAGDRNNWRLQGAVYYISSQNDDYQTRTDGGADSNYTNTLVGFNAARSSNVYKDNLKEARPINGNCYYVIRIK